MRSFKRLEKVMLVAYTVCLFGLGWTLWPADDLPEHSDRPTSSAQPDGPARLNQLIKARRDTYRLHHGWSTKGRSGKDRAPAAAKSGVRVQLLNSRLVEPRRYSFSNGDFDFSPFGRYSRAVEPRRYSFSNGDFDFSPSRRLGSTSNLPR